MSNEEREPYKKIAAQKKKEDSEDLTKKFTSLGVSYATLELQERELKQANLLMIETVTNMVRTGTISGWWK